MGNQTLVPSQIQSVESYLLDLKNLIQFRESLGSTTFMKTAKVSLIEALVINDDYLIENNTLSNIVAGSGSIAGISSISNIADAHSINSNLNHSNISIANSGGSTSLTSNSISINQNVNIINPTSSAHQIQLQKLNQQQMMRQKLQQLRELQQQVVVKIFPKYDLSIRLDLYSKRVREIKNVIYSRYGSSTNCLPFSELIITDRAAFLLRQYVKYNLYDRLSTRPFLTIVEKKWIAFQLLCAVNEIHSLQIVHGDMKTENVLINSFLWVSLTDFASYKPVYLSKNHPSADFNYYFDISRRRTCYLAPERLNTSKPDRFSSHTPNYQQQYPLDHENMYELMPPDPNDFKPCMDIFSLGCVIAELFMERPLFDFSHLLAYRDKKYDPIPELTNDIEDKNILEMLISMLSLDPNERKSANQYLQEQNDRAFPSYFVYLKSYISRFISVSLSPDDICVMLKNDLPNFLKNFKQNDIDISQSMIKSFHKNCNENQNKNDAFLILLSLLLSTIRKLKFSENKLIAIDLMATFSKYLDDSIVLDRILPYYLSLLDSNNHLSTAAPIVKSHVIYALNDCLSNIYNIDIQNLNIFPELIFDYLEILCKDESFLVRSTVAKTISNFALTSLRYLDTVFHSKRSFFSNNSNTSNNNLNKTDDKTQSELIDKSSKILEKDKEMSATITYDKEYEYYQFRITEIVLLLITDINQSSSTSNGAANAVKETLIRSDISKLCLFFNRQKTSEFLLPHMITILNEKTDWWVRAAFFDALCPVLTCIGWESVEIVKSLLEQGLRDSEEFVIHRTLITLSKMIEINLLDRQQISYFLATHIAPFLCHPSLWIRHGAINFITIVCKQHLTSNNSNCLNTADILCSVTPILAKFLKRKDIISFDKEEILFSCLKQPIKRAVYDRISQDGQSDQLFIYLNQRSEIRLLTNQNYLPGYVDCSDPNVQQFFEKLCKLGFIEEDEDKLLHLKDFIDKTRISRLSSSLHNTDNSTSMMLGSSTNNSVLLNVNVIKENFSLKDGYITIMKERFQRCNYELLNTRKEKSSLFNIEKIINDNNRREKYASNNSINESVVSSIALSNEAQNQFNAEWRLMFGGGNLNRNTNSLKNPTNENSSLNEQSVITPPTSATKQKISLKNSPTEINTSSNIQNIRKAQQERLFPHYQTDCTVEVDKYLDLCKFLYEEHRLKQQRVNKYKETIASSTSSNTNCLSSSIGKWKPKGFLLAHSNEHTKEINKLCRNSDSTYFASCSTIEQSVKIWSTDNLLDGKSGFFKSMFTYDKHQDNSGTFSRPTCTTFYNKNSLAILCEDFKFYVIDFNSNRTQYRLYANDKLFRTSLCKNCLALSQITQPSFDNSTFYYLYRSKKTVNTLTPIKACYCSANYPIDMIRIDDSSPTWPMAAPNFHEYFTGTRSSNVKGLFAYSTSTGDFTCIDMRTRSRAFDIRRDLKRGYITQMITDPWYTWLACGTSTGNIEIFDFRFMVPVKLFEHRSKTAVSRLCNHPMLNDRLVASYQGNNEISIWNMSTEAKTSVNSVKTNNPKLSVEPELVFWGVQSVPPLSQHKISSYYISGLIGVSAAEENGSNGLICASSDMKMRFIDLNDPAKDSYIISSAFNFQQNTKTSSDLSSHHLNSPTAPSTNLSSNQTSTLKTNEFANSIMAQNINFEMRVIEGNKVLLELDSHYSSNQQYSSPSNLSSPVTTYSYNSPALTHQSYFTHHQDAISDLIVCYNPINNKNQPLVITSGRDGTLKIWR